MTVMVGADEAHSGSEQREAQSFRTPPHSRDRFEVKVFQH
jgi:hypothetical protein